MTKQKVKKNNTEIEIKKKVALCTALLVVFNTG